MSGFADLEAVFLAHLDWIDRVASIACIKHGVRGVEAEGYVAWIRMKVMEDDYAVLRNFRGGSGLKTYLASVVVRQFFYFDRARRGRWRPSAEAARLGTPARDLEMLVRRDGYTVAQAGEKLRTMGLATLSDAELARLLATLPQRPPLRPVEESWGVLNSTPGPYRADEPLFAAEADARRREMMDALERALEQLEPEDRVIVKMHIADGYTLAEVARALGLEQSRCTGA